MKHFLLILFGLLVLTVCTSVSIPQDEIRRNFKELPYIKINYVDSIDRLVITGDSGTYIDLFITGKNEYSDLDTFVIGFAIIPVNLNLESLKRGEYNVIVKTDSLTVHKFIRTYLH